MAALGGALLLRRHRSVAFALITVSLVSLYLFSIAPVAGALHRGLQTYPPVTDAETGVGAIVILGGGSYRDAPEYGGDTVGRFTLQRVRYGARLHRRSGLPILVSGGLVLREQVEPEAQLMADALREDFGVPVRWIEDRSRNTAENALFSVQKLNEAGIERILLVTHASHMPRSAQMFEQYGIDATPAPTIFKQRSAYGLLDFLPSAQALSSTSSAVHEYLGLLWYRLRY